MKKIASLLFFLVVLILLSGCNPTESITPSVTSAQNTSETVAIATKTLEATPAPTIDTSMYTPEIVSTSIKTIYEQSQRATLGQKDTFFWPDGNIGVIPLNEGQYRFFTANSIRTAVSVGTPDDPGAIIEKNRLTITGVDPQFDYASGGPVYLDPESGLLLMFYHAERHLGGNGLNFHAAIGLALSEDNGESFHDLGIILETNAVPDANAPCCADMGGATFTINDGQFMIYYRDRLKDLSTIELAVASAPVSEVIEAAKNGGTSTWIKYHQDGPQPGISGKSTPLEIGNPPTDWFSVSYNTSIDRYIMAIATHDRAEEYNFQLYLTTSEDGYRWSPRVLLLELADELTYPTIISPEGDPFNTGETFYIYYVKTPRGVTRFHNTNFERMTVTLSGDMLEPTHTWEFNNDSEGWKPLYHMASFNANNGSLLIQTSGVDPYMISPSLAVNGDSYQKIEVRMKSGQSGTGQFFFTTKEVPNHIEDASLHFQVKASEDFVVYTIDMSAATNWKGTIGDIRFDPIDQPTTIEIDYIRLIP